MRNPSYAQRQWFWTNFGAAARQADLTVVKAKIAAVREVLDRMAGPEVPLRKAAQRMADMTHVQGSEADALGYAEQIGRGTR